LVILATIPLDHVRFPALAGRLLPMRFAGVGAMAVILALLRIPYGRRQPRALGLLPPLAGGALVQTIAFASGGHASPVNVDTIFTIRGVAVLIPWTPRWSALACLLIVGEHVAAAATAGPLGVRARCRGAVGGAIAGARGGGAVQGRGARMVPRGGGERGFVCQVSRLADRGVILCGQDITDRKSVEEALQASEARLRIVMTGAPVILFTLDHAGICTLSEGRGLARLGLKPGQVVGMHFSEVLAAYINDPDRSAEYFRRA